MPYQYREYPSLAWSFSRMKMLNDCERKYYYNYYASHNGWLSDASKNAQKIYRLKNLHPIDALFGQLFHDLVKDAILSTKREFVTPENFKKLVNKKLKGCYLESLNNVNEWMLKPKRYAMISELYYDGDLSREKKNRIIEKASVCSKHVFKSESYQEITEGNVRLLELDELKSFEYNGMTAYVKIDTLYEAENGKIIVVDWKTSVNQAIEDVDQLMIYAFYVCNAYGVKLGNIEMRLEYVMENKCAKYSFGERDMELVERRLVGDIDRMKGYLEDGLINKPLPEDEFLRAKKGVVCRLCVFKEECS